jgi:hypothetical protein
MKEELTLELLYLKAERSLIAVQSKSKFLLRFFGMLKNLKCFIVGLDIHIQYIQYSGITYCTRNNAHTISVNHLGWECRVEAARNEFQVV